ncbi:MAG: hypothetical protein ACK4I0_00005 [Brevundimonas sp.]|uniref:hypothetical protein n=1 Tax=Brevundimonas sp. TaxID=1871086 RepID=UPI003918D1BA
MSLLATASAFGLAALGTGLGAALTHYIRSSIDRERGIVDRISLESAVALAAGRLAAGAEHRLAPHDVEPVVLNGRSVALWMSLPEGKHDLVMDEEAELAEVLEASDLPRSLTVTAQNETGTGLARLSASSKLTAAQEDQLRRRFTVGRAPEPLAPEAMQPDGDDVRTIAPGDQIDLRAELASQRFQSVLWVRLRFGGERVWRTHDYRQLRVGE